jgi:hypothetical protein
MIVRFDENMEMITIFIVDSGRQMSESYPKT